MYACTKRNRDYTATNVKDRLKNTFIHFVVSKMCVRRHYCTGDVVKYHGKCMVAINMCVVILYVWIWFWERRGIQIHVYGDSVAIIRNS